MDTQSYGKLLKMTDDQRKAYMESQKQVEGKWKNPLGNHKFP